MLILYLILLVATALTVIWFVLLGKVTPQDWVGGAYNKVLQNLEAIEKLQRKDAAKAEKRAGYHGAAAAFAKLLYGGSSEKAIGKLQAHNAQLQSGNLKGVDLLSLPGYALLRRFGALVSSNVYKTVLLHSIELYGRKHAEQKARHLMAQVFSYPFIGTALALVAGVICIGMGNTMFGVLLLVIGPVMVGTLCYSLLDGLKKKAAARRETISRQFPNVVSKLALLVTSGMIMDRAWKETAFSQPHELYMEMRKTSEELDNLVSPEAAYGGFINRCNTKETAKLASAIMQNLSKGNAEIGRLLKEMAREAWLERRHTAKRDAEKANSKLIIPTMMLFAAILIMIMVPVAMSFSGGF